MNLKKANNQIERIDNNINYWLNKKELEIAKIMPQAVDFNKEVVKTSRIETNKFLYYASKVENIDLELDFLYKEKEILLEYIEKELKRLNKYSDVEKLIVYYKEESLEKYTWSRIAKLVHYSETQCRRIYRKYKKQRNI